MITLVQKAMRYVAGGSDGNAFQVTENCRPKLEDFVMVSHSAPETKEFEGAVTAVDSSCVVINQDIYCEPTKFPLVDEVSLGARVRGSAQRTNECEAWRVEKVELVREEWDGGVVEDGSLEATTRRRSHFSNSEAISCKELVEGMPGIFKKDLLSSLPLKPYPSEESSAELSGVKDVAQQPEVSDTLIGKVTGIYGDAVTLNESVYFKLSSANFSIDIIPGDWIVCDVDGSSTKDCEKTQFNGTIQVSSYKPLRKKRVRGELTHSFPSHFIINEEIFCTRALAEGSSVRVGDSVTVEVIESQQGRMCWRAVALFPPATSPSTQELGTQPVMARLSALPQLGLMERRMQNILEDKENICISQALRFPSVKLGVQATISAIIKNNGSEPRTLTRVYFVAASQDCQFSVSSCSAGGIVDSFPRSIEPSADLRVQLLYTSKLLGMVKQLCIFEFETFQIGRYVRATAEDPHMASLAPSSTYTPWQRPQNPAYFMPKDRGIVQGQKSFKPSFFLPVKLPGVRVPEHLWQVANNREELLRMAPVLTEPLTIENYKTKFSLLLHLEEIEMTQQMRQFDMTRASFSACGEYLSLTVPGLAERRPSLLIGDTVVAMDPSNSSGVEYEGCIHQVLHTQVLLKFHPAFHSDYGGEDYMVRFNFNRTPLRRCHFALDFTVKQLGPDILFPFKLKLQLPQVCYIDLEVQSSARSWMHSQSTISWCVPVAESTGSVATNENSGMSKFQDSKEYCTDTITVAKKEAEHFAKSDGIEERFGMCTKKNLNVHKTKTLCDSNDCSGMKSLEQRKQHKAYQQWLKTHETQDQGKVNVHSLLQSPQKLKNMEKCQTASRTVTETQMLGGQSPSPRLPVVTRLFGVPSPGSSANSSMCCSDDESKVDSITGNDTNKNISDSNRVFNGDQVLNLTKIETASALLMQAQSKTHSEKQNNSIYSSSTSISVDCTSLLTKENEIMCKDRRSCAHKDLNKQSLKEGEIKPPLHKAGGRSPVSHKSVNPTWSHEKHKDPDVNTERKTYKLLPRSLEQNLYKKMDKNVGLNCSQTQTLSNTMNKEGIVWSEKQGNIEEKCPDNFKNEGYCSKYEKSNNQKPSISVLTKSKNSEKLHQTNLQYLGVSDSRLQITKSCGNDFDNRNISNKYHYVIPVMPCSLLRQKDQESSLQLPVLNWFNRKLNQEQKLAVRRILEGTTRPLPYVIYGPPGTGKTVTLVEAALQIATMMHHSRLLIVTPSNSASDLVLERLVEVGRLGKTDMVRLNAFQRARESISEVIRPYCCNGDELAVRSHQRVIVTTATTAGVLYLQGLHQGHFTHVLVDEAGQLTEPECLVSLGLVNRSTGQVVLAGDPKQLGPVVYSRWARRGGLQQSLLQRLCQTVLYQPQEMASSGWLYEPSLVTRLVKNYRSHPHILAVPSRLFYHNTLQPCADTKTLEHLLLWEELPCDSCPVLFHGVVGDNLQEGDSPSWFNPAEAFQVVRYMKSLVLFGVKPSTMGIITPYRKQVEKIQKLLTTFGIDEGVKVGTVEEFQGQERTVILISTVRSSSSMIEVDVQHSLGFMKCSKRFNVAITRAKGLLVVVGNPFLLCSDDSWQELITFCLEKGAYRGPDLQ